MDGMIDISNIDWNVVWRESHAKSGKPFRDLEFLNERAPDFAWHAESGDYIDQFLASVNIRPKPFRNRSEISPSPALRSWL